MKFCILIICILIGLFLFSSIRKSLGKRRIRRRVLAEEGGNYGERARDIASGIGGKTRSLYKELIRKVHPDQFLDERNSRANELTQLITKSKHNYSDLKNIEKEVSIFLNEEAPASSK